MTQPKNTATNCSTESTNRPTFRKGYEWTCPYCAQSRINKTNSASDKKHALNALKKHISASIGDGHDNRGSMPADIDDHELSDYVTEIEKPTLSG